MGYDRRPPTEPELTEMQSHIVEAMEAGAWLLFRTHLSPSSYAIRRNLLAPKAWALRRHLRDSYEKRGPPALGVG